jgi:hypothetical protein
LYKTKGTRSSIEFFLRFLGAPEPLIKIDEYVYKVTSIPSNANFEDDIDELIRGTKANLVITGYTESGGVITSYLTGQTIGTTSLSREEYPIDSEAYPRKVTNTTSDIFFQKGSGWYDLTTDHRSSNIIDTDLSVLTGRTKTIKTKPKPYTYGEDYFDNFRTLPGLDYGFILQSEIDNSKTMIADDEYESKLVLNRKNLDVYLSPSQGIEYNIYRQSRDLELSFGTLQPQTGVTFAEFVSDALNQVITNSNTMKYDKSYLKLQKVYNDYITNTGFTPYNFISLNEFIDKMTPHWVGLVEQFIPSTTLWTGGNLVSNTIFNRCKYKYQIPRYGLSSDVDRNNDNYVCQFN